MPPRTVLDWNYNVADRVPGFADHVRRWEAASADARRFLPNLPDLAYGDDDRQRLDFFLARGTGPVLAFLHGGYWRARDKSGHSCFAAPYVAAGIDVAVVNYPLVPTRTLGEVVESCRRAVIWIASQARRLRGADGGVFVAGHSAGGHLATMIAATDWTARGVCDHLVTGFCSVSGIYDLEPLSRSFLNETLNLTSDDCADLSPARLPPPVGAPGIVAVGGGETGAFLWQQNELVRSWHQKADLNPVILPLEDHFTTFDSMSTDDGTITLQLIKTLTA